MNEVDLEFRKKEFSGEISKKVHIYVLKLEKDKWWIGISKNVRSQVRKMKKGKGNKWIQENALISVEEILAEGNIADITLDYMKKYGWEKVRGTKYYDGIFEKYIPRKILDYIYEQKQEDGIK